nr:MAG TPA: hypothetical protein [Caudoviricetes sp.]
MIKQSFGQPLASHRLVSCAIPQVVKPCPL